MSTYLLLQDHAIAGQVLPAGSIQSTADVGGLLPTGWNPTPNVDPLDAAAVAAFYAAGPARAGLIYIKPITYWQNTATDPWSSEFSPEFGPIPSMGTWSLTGLGSALAPINGDASRVDR